jgi:cyclase
VLAKRIIPCLDVENGKVVKGIRFKNLRVEGDPAELAYEYERQGADEVVFLDITASYEKREIFLDVVRRTADTVFIPFTVGGGIRNAKDVERILLAGADKVALNTAAVRRPEAVKECSDRFGSQCTVVSMDAKRNYVDRPRGKRNVVSTSRGKCWWNIYVEGGRIPVPLDAVSWARRVEKLGAGEILLTSMDSDGTQSGYDIELTKTVTGNVNIPVIASGGAGGPEEIHHALTDGNADAALAASIFHESQYTVEQVKRYLRDRGVMVRISSR